VRAEFARVVGFRHQHATVFGRSDLYFVVLMRALSTDILMDEGELQACEWMAVDAYIELLSQPGSSSMNLLAANLAKAAAAGGEGAAAVVEVQLPKTARSVGGKFYHAGAGDSIFDSKM